MVLDYAIGSTTGTVTVPAGAQIHRVRVVANAVADTTVVIGTGNPVITIPAGSTFDEPISGRSLGTVVTIGGAGPQSYLVGWVI